jgi:hypothetical protein
MPRAPRRAPDTLALFPTPADPHSLEAATIERLREWRPANGVTDIARSWVTTARLIDLCARSGNAAAAPKLLERWEQIRGQLVPPAAATDSAATDDPILALIAAPALRDAG